MIAFAEPQKFSDPVEVLFVGGPLDGRWRALGELLPWISAAEPVGPRTFRSVLDRGCDIFREVVYRAHTFRGERDREFFFYAPEGWEANQIMTRLIAGYFTLAKARREGAKV